MFVSKKRFSSVFVFITLALAAILSMVSPAYASAATGSISGQVTTSSGSAIAYDYVTIFSVTTNRRGTYFEQVESTATDASGNYTFYNLEPGTYTIRFLEEWSYGNYAFEYYNNKANLISADHISLADGENLTGIDAQVEEKGRISGTVTSPDGSPLRNINVRAYALVYESWGSYWREIGMDNTLSDGTYNVPTAGTGEYKLQFTDYTNAYLSEYYTDKSTVDDADVVNVTAAAITSGIDEVLSPSAKISGTVTDADGNPLSGAYVNGYELTTTGECCQSNSSSAYTDSDGNYTLQGFRTGQLKLYFWHSSGEHIGEWYSDKTEMLSADWVTATEGSTTTGINAQLGRGGAISGTVTGPGGSLLGYGYIYVHEQTTVDGQVYWPVIRSATTSGSGSYTVSGLAAGTYKVSFGDYSWLSNFLPKYYNDKHDVESADWVTVTGGATTSGIDAELAEGGTINGRVVDSSGNPINEAFIDVYTYQTVDGVAGWQTGQGAWSDSEGNFTVRGVSTQDYKLRVSHYQGAYVDEYFNDKRTLSDADTISGVAGANTNVGDISMTDAGHITGTVTNMTGDPIGRTRVTVYSEQTVDGGASWEETEREFGVYEDGTYTVNGLAAGNYRIRVESRDGTLATEYYSDKATLAAADEIAVPAGGTVTANFVLADMPADAYESDDDMASAVSMTADGTIHDHTISPIGDEDWIKFDGVAGVNYTIGVINQDDAMHAETFVYDSAGNELDEDSSGGHDDDALISFTPSTTGTYYVKNWQVHDLDGGTYSIYVTSDASATDSTAPVTTFGIDPSTPDGLAGWYTTTPDITLTSSEAGATEYQWDSTSDAGWLNYTAAISAIEGEHVLYFRSTDSAGNVESAQAETVKFDQTAPDAPEVAISSSGGNLTLSWSAVTDSDSGTAGYRIYDADSAALLAETVGASYTVDGAASNYLVKTLDNAGNQSSAGNTVSTSNTPAGSSVSVTLDGSVSLVFDNVSSAGITAVTTSSTPPASGNGFEINGLYYDFVTSAGYSGSITVTLPYDPAEITDPNTLKIYHYESGAWVQVPTTVDTTAHTITGTVTSFSWFAVGSPTTYSFSGFQQPINTDGSSIFKLGQTVPVKFKLSALGGGSAEGATARIYLSKISNGIIGSEVEAVSTNAPDAGNLFRYDPASGNYIFNLGTKSMTAGSWRVRVATGDGLSHVVFLSLRQ